MAKASIPKGTRDFGPEQMAGRNFIFETLKKVFEQYGYQPIETPSMEKLETLTGKYGEEGDRLIFKILSRGDQLARGIGKLKETEAFAVSMLAEEALRYDLTVPFARFVVQHRNELTFPFKRYQIQPVWRADRPQRGRYREFYQCDVDVIGSTSLLNEVELILMVSRSFDALGLPDVRIKINNRKILAGMAEVLGQEDKFEVLTVALDKLDKVGIEGVQKEMIANGLPEEKVAALLNLFKDNTSMDELKAFLSTSEIGLKGLMELEYLLNKSAGLGVVNVEADFTLARGLNYYTGAIIEVVHSDFPSSMCGGGRYDNLTGVFGLKDVSGVGVSFGADRIYDLMLEKNLFPEAALSGTDLLFVNFGEEEADYALRALKAIRENGISSELYPENAKMKKQMKYANDKGVRFVVLAGDKEMSSGNFTLKNMLTGEQKNVDLQELITTVK